MKKLLRKIHVTEDNLPRTLVIIATTGGAAILQANRMEGKYSSLYEVFYEVDYMEVDRLLKVYFDNSSIRLIDVEEDAW